MAVQWRETMSVTLYGIKACDTMKKARNWLDGRGILYRFHDYGAAGIEAVAVRQWVERLGWETVLNRAGTTFRRVPDAERMGLDAEGAIRLMVAQPSMIRRPVLVAGGVLLVGFKPEVYAARFDQSPVTSDETAKEV